MFKYISVEFPETALGPQTVYSFTLTQKRYTHELVTIQFKDWGAQFDVVTPGSPVRIRIANNLDLRDFYGYVHHVKLNRTPGKNFTEVTFIGGSFPMKQAHQALYKDTTVDAVIKQIADSYGFSCYAVPYNRVFPQLAQAGVSDWEFMVKLAKQCGYSLRTQNTELYFQPLLEDYTNLRAEAPTFTMRSLAHPDGSTIYSFIPVISESMPYEDATKAAVAISGVDIYGGTPMSITQQIRNAKTKQKTQIEFFDKFNTEVVATTTEVAAFEAEAAESRNAFPYRATAVVFGSPNLRPDMPVYLDGIGDPYSGYWTILETKHHVIEQELNVFVYTTTLYLGSDSLGRPNAWIDSKTISNPDSVKTRTIIPNVRQTKVNPTTELNKKTEIVTPAYKGSFGTIENRAKPNVNARSLEPATWKSSTRTLTTVEEIARRSPVIVERLFKEYGVFL